MTDTHARILDMVTVPLADRSYDIVVGEDLVANLGTQICDLLPQKRVVIVTDENVARLHLEAAEQSLRAAGIHYDSLVLPAGEGTKSYASYTGLMDRLLDLGTERRDTLIALGGGVIGDLTGFAAATLRRGVGFIQVPTTLLAQVDSSVGGKTGINTPYGKNLVGAFYQPKMVIADIGILDTLPLRELQAGYAEVIKYGLIDDLDFFHWCTENGGRILDHDRSALAYAVGASCRAKARIVAEDEREGGRRALLNLGHTFGHALEAECGYDGTILHGEAVAVGLVMALDLACRMGLAPLCDRTLLEAHLKAVGLRTSPDDFGRKFDTDTLIGHMMQDKKVEGGKLVFVTGGIGKAEIRRDVDLEILRAVLQAGVQKE